MKGGAGSTCKCVAKVRTSLSETFGQASIRNRENFFIHTREQRTV